MTDHLTTLPANPGCGYNRGASCWWPHCKGRNCHQRPPMPHPVDAIECPQVLGAVRTSLRARARRAQWHRAEQALIFGMSAAAIALVDLGSTDAARLTGNAIGLAAQPLWALSTIRHRQWGMVALTLFYTGVWFTGVVRYWPQ